VKAIAKVQPLAPVAIALDPLAIDRATTDAIAELNALQEATIDDDADLTAAAEKLREIVRDKDIAAAMLGSVVKPLEQAKKAVNAIFKTWIDTKTASEVKVKRLIADFQLAQQAEQRRQLAAAAKAAQERKPAELTTALVAASDAAPSRLEGVSVKPKWVARIKSPDLVPYEWCTPDVKRIDAHARETPTDRPPEPIAGVIFELDATVTARR
jgi:hypothetical protein